MNRSFGYWLELLLGYICGLLMLIIAYKNYIVFDFIYSVSFLDKLISISSTLFGFLLAILTLILQGNSPTVNTMKVHGSYNRLINFNKVTVISAILNCVMSLVLSFCSTLINENSAEFFKILAVLNFGIFGCVIINTVLFTFLFCKIIIMDQ